MRAVAECGSAGEVHALRAAALQISVALELLGWRALRSDVRWLRRAAGPLRDWDVNQGRGLSVPRHLLLQKLQTQLHSARAQCLPDALMCVLLARVPTERVGTRQQLKRLAHHTLRTTDPHRRRQRLRRLRLALDMLGLTEDAATVHHAVDRLGRWHDELQAPHSDTLALAYAKAQRAWKKAAPVVRRYAS